MRDGKSLRSFARRGFPSWAPLSADARGTAAIEFAMVLPFIAILFAGAVEFSVGFAEQIDLEQAAQRAVELAVVRPPTTNDNNATTGWEHIRTEAATAAGFPANTTNVTVTLYRDCNDTPETTYVHATNCGAGRQADYVRVHITGTYSRWIDWKSFSNQTSGATATLVGQATARVR